MVGVCGGLPEEGTDDREVSPKKEMCPSFCPCPSKKVKFEIVEYLLRRHMYSGAYICIRRIYKVWFSRGTGQKEGQNLDRDRDRDRWTKIDCSE